MLLLGGAGFIGSQITAAFVKAGHTIRVIDGLLPQTSGRRENLAGVAGQVEILAQRVEEIPDLDRYLADSDVIVDCMGWTLHRGALADPLYDMTLNLASHIHWLARLPKDAKPLVVYLGGRVQYANVPGAEIDEDTPQDPLDIQGIHKSAAERHFRLAARLRGLAIISLRFPACIGRGQPFQGDDIGLVGGFIREALAGRPIQVFGRGRKRAIAFVGDVVEIVGRLASARPEGFVSYNLRGEVLPIDELAGLVVEAVGRGSVEVTELPKDVAAIDSGEAAFRQDRLRDALGGRVPATPLADALKETVGYMKEVLA